VLNIEKMARRAANIYSIANASKRQPKPKRKLLIILAGIIVVGILCLGNLFDEEYDFSFETAQAKNGINANSIHNSHSNADANSGSMDSPGGGEERSDPTPSTIESTLATGIEQAMGPSDADSAGANHVDSNEPLSVVENDNGNGDSDGGHGGDDGGDAGASLGANDIADIGDNYTHAHAHADAVMGPSIQDNSEDSAAISSSNDDRGNGADLDGAPEVKNQVIDTTSIDGKNDDDDDDVPSSTKQEEITADPHLYAKEEKEETPAEESKSQDSVNNAKNMDKGYYDKMELFKASASGETTDTNVTISAGSNTDNNTETVDADDNDYAALSNLIGTGSEGNSTHNITVETADNSTAVTFPNVTDVTNVLNTTASNKNVSENADDVNTTVLTTVTTSHSTNDVHTDENTHTRIPATSNGAAVDATEPLKVHLNKSANQTLSDFSSGKINGTISDSKTNATVFGQKSNETLEKVQGVFIDNETVSEIEEVEVNDNEGEVGDNEIIFNDSEQSALPLELCKSNSFAHNLELSFEDIQIKVDLLLNARNIEELNANIVREEEVESTVGSKERNLRGKRRELDQVSSGDGLAVTEGANSTHSGSFSAKCRNDESSAMLPGMCGGLLANARRENCEYYVAYAGAVPDDLASMPAHIKLAKFSKCKINVVVLCGDGASTKLSIDTLIGDRDLDDSVKERIVVHSDLCLDSSKHVIHDNTGGGSDSVVAQPTPSQTDLLYIDLAGSSASPSDFLASIDGERLRLVNTNDENAKEEEIYLPKQIVFSGVDDKSIVDPSLQMTLLSIGYVLMSGLGPLSLMRFLCPKPPSMGGAASFVTAGFPM